MNQDTRAIARFKDQASRLAAYLADVNRKVTRTQSLEALSRALHGKPWNTVSAMLGAQAPELPARIEGRHDEATGAPLLLAETAPPLDFKQLKAITEDGLYYVDVVVPVSVWKLAEYGLDWLNDHVSERITGSIADLEDLDYRRFVPESAETLSADDAALFIRVTARWEPMDPPEDEDEDAEPSDQP